MANTVTMEMLKTTDAVEEFNETIKQDHMIGQWMFEPLLARSIGGPTPRGSGFVWPWGVARQRLAEASEALGPQGVGRTNLTFSNPTIPAPGVGTTHTIAAGIQIMREGEVCWSHRHSMSALRFVIEGHPDAFTTVDGESLAMEQYDLILTPRMAWHDHHNPSDQQVVWLDVLDIGLTLAVNAPFYEPYGEANQLVREDKSTSQELRANFLRPTWETARTERLPIRYKWSDVLAVLEQYGNALGDPYDGLSLRYTNPVTGGPTMTTMDCWVQQFAPGFHGETHRRTSSSVGFVISGSGTIEVEGTTLEINKHDTFAIPNYAWHRISTTSEEPLRIFSVHDKPAIESLGLYYEEPARTAEDRRPPKVPTVPLNPIYAPNILLDPAESR